MQRSDFPHATEEVGMSIVELIKRFGEQTMTGYCDIQSAAESQGERKPLAEILWINNNNNTHGWRMRRATSESTGTNQQY